MSLLNNNINITGTNDFNPKFNWQVGFNNYYSKDNLQFRATVRPLTDDENFNRIPSPIVLYEETGIIFNNPDNLGFWQFTLDKNISSLNGPHRDYQVVIEAHDENGNTSAGNRCGESEENGWSAYPFGYDIIAVTNPRQTGIELSLQTLTRESGAGAYVTGGHGFTSRQYIGSNGDAVIRFTSGNFHSDLVGGYIYTSYDKFPKLEAQINTGFWGNRVQKSRFDFSPKVGFVSHPHCFFNVRGTPKGYVSVSFFDELDRILLDDRGIDISTGLYLSNNAEIYSDAAAGSFSVGGGATVSSIITTGYPLPVNGTRVHQLIGSGIEIGRNSIAGTLNSEGNLTTILYLSRPVNNFYTGVDGNIVVGNLFNDNGGLGGNAIEFPFGFDNPGGFSGDSRVFLTNGTTKKISQIQVGDLVKSYRIIPPNIEFNYRVDNWVDVSGHSLGWANEFPSQTGIVTRIHTNTTNSYLVINSGGAFNGFFISPQQVIKQKKGTREGFKQANLIIEGDRIRGFHNATNNVGFDSDILVSTIQVVNQPLTVYNLEVEPFKTFYIDYNTTSFGIFAHDAILDYPD